ncbi:hypothetical protein CBR_g36292 [Chara braunii]|uniref:Replication protein A subunit n=1 Tax=Chara braunii TaxID=69332 RepID=A0A388LKL1_CHABU|nr:hypothetical protein CBR_g36292 [Chara braunii]|eukprot:GBG82762.1 hypothetical protein CBR_g36292 [Chara braunii]
MAQRQLTPNCIAEILARGQLEIHPIVQVLDVKRIGSAGATQERFRLAVSDGTHIQQAMIATQMNEKVRSGELGPGSILELQEYICNIVQSRQIIIVLQFEIIGYEQDQIGCPVPISDGLRGGSSQQQLLPPPGSAQDTESSGDFESSAQPPQEPRSGPIRPGGEGQARDGNMTMMPPARHADGPEVMAARGRGSSGTPGPGSVCKQEPPSSAGSYGTSRQAYTSEPQHPYGRMGDGGTAMPPPLYSRSGPVAKNEAAPRIIPIAALSPYQGRWTIKARVGAKQEKRSYSNARGTGCVFSFDLLDTSGEIRVTCFNQVAERFYEKIEVGRVYYVSKGSLKPAQKSFNHLNHDWEILLENSSTIDLVEDVESAIPLHRFDFKMISHLENIENNAMVDLIGLVTAVHPTQPILRKNGVETQKRVITLQDRSNRSVELTLWGGFCMKEGQELQDLLDRGGPPPVLAVKAGRVNEFSGKSVGTISSTLLLIDPDISEAAQLKGWAAQSGRITPAVSMSRESGGGGGLGRMDARKTISQIKDEGLGTSGRTDWITLRATIAFIKQEAFAYQACPEQTGDRTCGKKVMETGDGRYRCEKCDKSVPNCEYRYKLNFEVQDHTGKTWLTAFQDTGVAVLLDTTAQEMWEWKEMQDPRFQQTFTASLFRKLLFKVKVKEETYNDETRVKLTVVKAEKVNYVEETRVLGDMIRRMQAGLPMDGGVAKGQPTQQSQQTQQAQQAQQTQGYGSGAGSYGGSMGGGGGGGYGGGGGGGYGGGGRQGGGGGGGEHVGGRGNAAGDWARSSSGSMGSEGGYATSRGGGGYGAENNGYSGGGSWREDPVCYKCEKPGHEPRDCPSWGQGGNRAVAGGPGGYQSSSGRSSTEGQNCFKCQQPGHWAKECPNSGGGGGYEGGGDYRGGGMASRGRGSYGYA